MINAYFSPVFYVLHIMNNPQSEVCIKYHEHVWIVFEWKCNSIFVPYRKKRLLSCIVLRKKGENER